MKTYSWIPLVLFGGLSCNQPATPLDPNAIIGTYALVQVGSSTLPTILYPGPQTAATVFADTLRLRQDGRGTRTTIIRWDDLARQTQGSVMRQQSDYAYRVVGSGFELWWVCPINANCTLPGPMAANLTAAGIRVESGSSVGPLLFVRVLDAQ
jgi:hypothetical protein